MPCTEFGQLDELVVDDPKQAQALWDFGFLQRFLEPASPSDVARDMSIPANRAHHRAKRHLHLKLLKEVKRENRKVYYQLVARSFRHLSSLVKPSDADRYSGATLDLLQTRFAAAFERAEDNAARTGVRWHIHKFDLAAPWPNEQAMGATAPQTLTMRYPPHFQSMTLRLSSKRYVELVRHIAVWLDDLEEEPAGRPCTIAVVALDGVLHDGVESGNSISSFLPFPFPFDASERKG